MPFHFVVRFEPAPGAAAEFREELLRVVEPTRAEPGCLGIRAFESVREPVAFAIHSEWVDEAAFERHSGLPHTLRFVEAAERLQGRPVAGLRSRQIAGGPGAAAKPPR
jgi:quinol monooxygenase YgiN